MKDTGNSSQEWTRRKFIYTVTGAGTAMMLNAHGLWAYQDMDPRLARIAAKTIGIDTHNHVAMTKPISSLFQTGMRSLSEGF